MAGWYPSCTRRKPFSVVRTNDFAWSKWNDAITAVREIDLHIAAIERGDLSRWSDLALLFAPTGAIQEVAESSGWGVEFLALASRFDQAAAEVRS